MKIDAVKGAFYLGRNLIYSITFHIAGERDIAVG